MNERIRKLAEQSGLNIPLDTEYNGHIYRHALEKFAKLIVSECVDICQDIDGEDNIDARSGRQDCAVEIREHFGVEETKREQFDKAMREAFKDGVDLSGRNTP